MVDVTGGEVGGPALEGKRPRVGAEERAQRSVIRSGRSLLIDAEQGSGARNRVV